jgi:hypothetical protein
MKDDRQYAPATLRNRDFILDVLRGVLPTTGVILEIASGSGEHVVHFARCFPKLVFQPSDPSRCTPERRRMGEGHRRHECARAHRPGRLAFGLANRISRRDYLHQHDPHLTLGGDTGIDQGGCCDTFSGVAVLSLWSIQTRRLRNGTEQPSVRPEPSRPQSELGSARYRSGRRDGALCWILGTGYH